jgi:CheY-like chemotaxis protein
MRPKKVILLVDPSESGRAARRFMLWTRGYRVLSASANADAVAILETSVAGTVDLLLCRYEPDGAALVTAAKRMQAGIKTILFSEVDGCFDASHAADYFVTKGALSSAGLLEIVKITLARKRGPKKKGPGSVGGAEEVRRIA